MLASTNTSEENDKIYSKAHKKFDNFFQYEKNVEVLSKGDTKTLYLDAVGDNSVVFLTYWYIQLLLNNDEVSFMLDTGAEVTAITVQAYQFLLTCLQNSQKQLGGPNNHPLVVVGTFTTKVSYRNRSCSSDIYVVHNLVHNLLGLKTITDLHLIVLLDAVQTDTATFNRNFLHFSLV